MDINNIILDLINCWNHGELRYINNNETGTFSDFITIKKKKNGNLLNV